MRGQVSEDAPRLEALATREVARTGHLPFNAWVVLVSTGVAVITSGITVFGLPLLAFAWIVPLSFALVDLAVLPGKVRLPIGLWAPWIGLVFLYLLNAEADHAFQRSIMLLAPLVVGLAISKHDVGPAGFASFRRGYVLLTLGLLAGAVLKTGLSVKGLPDSSPLAPEVMTGALLATLYAAEYSLGRRRDLLWWGVLALLPVFGLTRTGMMATAVTLPFTLAPLGWQRRALCIGLIAIAFLGVFETERFQRKMFVSGHGDITDLAFDNPNVFMSGRRRVWEYMEWQISERPWFGYGANASEAVVAGLTNGATHPHNDWLRVRYEYGTFGAVVLGLCLLAQLAHLWVRARRVGAERRGLAFAAATSFMAFAIFMTTDNIILYASYFGHLQFTIAGLAYSSEPATD
jgi:O-antigen ligase